MRALLLTLLALCLPVAASPRQVRTTEELSRALVESDHVVVLPGTYRGHFVIDRPLVLEGTGRPVLDGGGDGTVLVVNAPDVTIRGFEIRGSGIEPEQDHGGMILNAPRARVEDNVFRDVLFGIVVNRADGSRLVGNDLESKTALDLGRKGDGVRVWYSQGVVIEGNRAHDCRDLVAWYSSDLTFRRNEVSGGRYGVHFMYCDRSLVEKNDLHDNSVGIYTMYSSDVRLLDNQILRCRGASGYGLGFKDANDVLARGNVLVDNRAALFLDSTPTEPGAYCRIEANVLAFNDLGVAMFPSVHGAAFEGNTFYENAEQVSLEGSGGQQDNRFLGNYWSDYAGCDLDGDGRGDQPYRSEKLFENLADRDPNLRLFQGTLAQEALDRAARMFPLVSPQPKLEDGAPRMSPPVLPPPEPVRRTALGWLWPALALIGLGALRVRFRVTAAPRKGIAMSTTMIDVRHVTKKFGSVTALSDVSFALRQGEALALWGANGAGKSTLIRCLLGLHPYQGELAVAGCDARRQGKTARSSVGYVPQELSFHDDLTVAQTLQFYAALRGASVDGALARVGLEHCPERAVGALSGGMKQRLALALALLGDPPLLVLDEPTSNLDLQGREEFLKLLIGLREQGKTMLFTSHRLDEVLALADQVVVLEEGRVARIATPSELVGTQVIKLHVPRESLDEALAQLDQAGYQARRNGRGVWVSVPSDRKASPIQTLARAGILVTDFEV